MLGKKFMPRSQGRVGEKPGRASEEMLEALGGSIAIERHVGMSLLRADGYPLAAVVTDHPEVCNMVETFLA